jgi:hypothetical protein
MIAFVKRISFFVALLGILSADKGFAQSATVSPYSRYGIGDLQNQNGVESFSMGNTGIALHNDTLTPDFINLKNPASYFYNRVTTYEAGVLTNNMELSTEGTRHFNNNTYFGYFAIAFPIGKRFGGSFGLRPMSSVGYNINTTGNIDSAGTSIGNTDNQYVGSGGINQLHFGLAYNVPHTRLVLGANLSFLFGYLNYQQNIIYPLNIAAYNSQVTENINIHGFSADYGFMYTVGKTRDSGWQFIVGGTMSMGSSLFANYNLLAINYLVATPQTNVDTIVDSNASGRIKLPMTYGGGITIIKRDKNNNDMFTFTADYSMQRWSQYSVLGEAQNLSNTTQMSFGAQYIPAKNTTFFRRMHYRIGYSQTQTYLNLGTPIVDRCVSFGIAMPVGPPFAPPISNQLGVLNIGFQLGMLGTTTNNELQEEYAKILVAFTFNSKWFQKHLYQ